MVGTNFEPRAPEVAAKVAVLCPEETVTLAGTVSTVLLLLIATVVALGAVWLSVTVHVLVPLLASADGVHDTEESWAPVAALSVKVCEPPFTVAVSTAVWFERTAATVAMKILLV